MPLFATKGTTQGAARGACKHAGRRGHAMPCTVSSAPNRLRLCTSAGAALIPRLRLGPAAATFGSTFWPAAGLCMGAERREADASALAGGASPCCAHAATSDAPYGAVASTRASPHPQKTQGYRTCNSSMRSTRQMPTGGGARATCIRWRAPCILLLVALGLSSPQAHSSPTLCDRHALQLDRATLRV